MMANKGSVKPMTDACDARKWRMEATTSQNGTTVPGPSRTAPTRPAPYLAPSQLPTAGSPNINAATFKGQNERDTMRKLHGTAHEPGAAESKEKHE